jgi:hypothetical protein
MFRQRKFDSSDGIHRGVKNLEENRIYQDRADPGAEDGIACSSEIFLFGLCQNILDLFKKSGWF